MVDKIARDLGDLKRLAPVQAHIIKGNRYDSDGAGMANTKIASRQTIRAIWRFAEEELAHQSKEKRRCRVKELLVVHYPLVYLVLMEILNLKRITQANWTAMCLLLIVEDIEFSKHASSALLFVTITGTT